MEGEMKFGEVERRNNKGNAKKEVKNSLKSHLIERK